MNANLFHNIANLATLFIAAATGMLVASGCTDVGGVLDCSGSWIDPKVALGLIFAIQGAKLTVNIKRDGITGLTKPQPPVEK